MDAPRPSNLHQYIKECKKHNVTDVVRVCDPTYSEANLRKAGIVLHEMPYPDGHSPPDDVLDRWLTLVDERFLQSYTTTYGGAGSGAGGAGTGRAGGNGLGGVMGGVSGDTTAAAGGGGSGGGLTVSSNNTQSSSVNSNAINTADNHNNTIISTGIINNSSHHVALSAAGPTIAVHCVAGLGRAPVLVAIALIEFAKMEPVDAATFIRKHRRGAINNTQLDWLERYKRRYKANAGAGCCSVM